MKKLLLVLTFISMGTVSMLTAQDESQENIEYTLEDAQNDNMIISEALRDYLVGKIIAKGFERGSLGALGMPEFPLVSIRLAIATMIEMYTVASAYHKVAQIKRTSSVKEKVLLAAAAVMSVARMVQCAFIMQKESARRARYRHFYI